MNRKQSRMPKMKVMAEPVIEKEPQPTPEEMFTMPVKETSQVVETAPIEKKKKRKVTQAVRDNLTKARAKSILVRKAKALQRKKDREEQRRLKKQEKAERKLNKKNATDELLTILDDKEVVEISEKNIQMTIDPVKKQVQNNTKITEGNPVATHTPFNYDELVNRIHDRVTTTLGKQYTSSKEQLVDFEKRIREDERKKVIAQRNTTTARNNHKHRFNQPRQNQVTNNNPYTACFQKQKSNHPFAKRTHRYGGY